LPEVLATLDRAYHGVAQATNEYVGTFDRDRCERTLALRVHLHHRYDRLDEPLDPIRLGADHALVTDGPSSRAAIDPSSGGGCLFNTASAVLKRGAALIASPPKGQGRSH
jgi:hypothetical protein